MALSREKTKLLERLRNSRFRPREGLFIVEGTRGAREVLEGGLALGVRFALRSPRLSATDPGGEVGKALRARAVPLEEVSDKELGAVSDTEHSQGILLVVQEPSGTLSSMVAGPDPKILVLDGIQDPGNAGTLIRSGHAFGLDGVVALEGTVDLFNPKVVRSSAGALGHIPVTRVPWSDLLHLLDTRTIPLYVAQAGGEDVRTFNAPRKWVLAVGNEGIGPRQALMNRADRILAVPMRPGMDSLNAGVAGAILLFALAPSGGNGTEI